MAGFKYQKHQKQQTYPLDRIAISLILSLSIVVGFLILWGDRTFPKVRSFSWANTAIGAEDTAFTLNFNRPMNWESVTQRLQIAPPLPGKTSWSGRRLAYTLTETVPYGQAFQLTLKQATSVQGHQIEPFSAGFKSRDLAFAYLGVNGDEAGRLILSNVTQGKKTILTPENLTVISFKIYPKGDRILFSATEKTAAASEVGTKLYQVTTGITGGTTDGKAGEIKTVIDNQDYQILKFDLSADGNRIVVQRAARQNMGAANLWQIYQDSAPELLKTQGGGDFLIAPDSQTLVVAQGQGLALVSLNDASTDKPLDFLPKFGMVLSFAKDGSAAAMLKFNTDYTRALYLVTNQGVQRELLRTKGSIISVAFTPQRDALYCLLTRLLPGKDYIEQPYIAKISLNPDNLKSNNLKSNQPKTSNLSELLTLPVQQNMTLSLAPDGSRLLLDQTLDTNAAGNTQLDQPMNSIQSLTLLPQPSSTPTVLAVGTKPQWLP